MGEGRRGKSLTETARFRELLNRFNQVLDRVRAAIRERAEFDDDTSAVETLARVDGLAEKYRKALELRRLGMSVERINAELKIRSVSRWFDGAIPRLLLNLDPRFRWQFGKQIPIPPQPSAGLAFILGVFCGKSGVGRSHRAFEVRSRDGAVVERLTKAFQVVFTMSGTCAIEEHGGIRYHRFRVGSNQLARYFETITSRNRAVPVRELHDRECRLAFLRGFFASCGSAIRPERRKVHVVKSRNRALLDEVAVVLKREGVLAAVNGADRAELLIQDQNDLNRFRELGLLSSTSDIDALDKICAHRPKRRMFTLGEYRTAMQIMQANSSLTASGLSALIAEQTQGRVVIDKSVLRQWRENTKPDCVRRAENLAQVECAMRSTSAAKELRGGFVRRVRMLREPERLLPLLREIAWLQGDDPDEFPVETPELARYRQLFERLKLPFSPEHEAGWHNRVSLKNSVALTTRIVKQITRTRSPEDVLRFLAELGRLTGIREDKVSTAFPTLRTYRSLFHERGLAFSAVHECGWHEAINSAPETHELPTIARGVHNLIRREWHSLDDWSRELPRGMVSRCLRTIDSLVENRRVLQRDLIELLIPLGVEKAGPAMRYLVGLSIARQSQVLAHLAATTTAVRAELSALLGGEDRLVARRTLAHARIYDLFPGIEIRALHRDEELISKCLAKRVESLRPVKVSEPVVMEWLDHVPAYRPRLGMLTEVAKKAQHAGLDPRWAVSMMIDTRVK